MAITSGPSNGKWFAQPDNGSDPATSSFENDLIQQTLTKYFRVGLIRMNNTACDVRDGKAEFVGYDRTTGLSVKSWDQYSTPTHNIWCLTEIYFWKLSRKMLTVDADMYGNRVTVAEYLLYFGDFELTMRCKHCPSTDEIDGVVLATTLPQPILDILTEDISTASAFEKSKPLEESYPDNPNVGAFS